MKKIYRFTTGLVLVAMTGIFSTSCSDESKSLEGEGRLSIRAAISQSTDKIEKSRTAEDEETVEYTEDVYKALLNVWITRESDKAVVRKFYGSEDLPADCVTLNAGAYRVEAWTGDSVTASWNRRFLKGESPVTVTAGETSSVTVTCRIANVVASVNQQGVGDALSDYTMTIYPEALESRLEEGDKSLTYDSKKIGTIGGDAGAKGYFMMPKAGRNLKWVLKGKNADGSEYEKSGVIENAQSATEYILNVKYTKPGESNEGGAAFTVTVDENPLETKEEPVIVLRTAPEIGLYVDDADDGHAGMISLDEPIFAERGNVGARSILIRSSAILTSVCISNERLSELFPGIGGTSVDLMKMTDEVKNKMMDGGLFEVYSEVKPETESSLYKIKFASSFTDGLAEGQYDFVIEAEDEDEIDSYNEQTGTTQKVKRKKRSTATLQLVVSDAKVMADEINTTEPGLDFNETEALLTGTVLKDNVGEAGFYWGTSENAIDTYVAGTPMSRSIEKGSKYSARLTGLRPGVKYYYVAASDKEKTTRVQTFTTPNRQLPNAGFEGWWKDGKIWRLYEEGGSMFWDSGNTGSSTMSKNVTEYDESIKHSGTRSLRLSSQFVGVGAIGKFAAGNAFIGKYLKTDGTDGVLGWGRPFTGRPKQLKGWVKYSPVAITDVADNAPSEYKKGDMDRAIIYIALLDGSKAQGDASEAGWGDFPVVVKTKTTELFNKDGADVIAYGERVFEGEIGANGMVEFTINLDYKRSGVIPTYILLTMSASKGGDYFTGGSGSKMWIDDLELVY